MEHSIQVTFDCHDPASQAAFWAEAMHYVVEPPPIGYATWEVWFRAHGITEEHWNDVAAALDPDGAGPRFFFQKVPEGKVAKNRVHLDLNVSGGPGTALEERRRRVLLEVARLKALGASDHRGSVDQDGEFWVRMNDPEGNEFCVQ